MPWPLISDYSLVIQKPIECFDDPDLRDCKVELDALGYPKVWAGGFACVYSLKSKNKHYAVKCFFGQQGERSNRYNEVSKYLQNKHIHYLIKFEYIEKGICVDNNWYPILKMRWVNGKQLNAYIEGCLESPDSKHLLLQLSDRWQMMLTTLQKNQIAHGDLQHGNVLVTLTGELYLVDYDCMYVPALRGKQSIELGHPHYQHPHRSPKDYNDKLDEFSGLVIRTAIQALAEQPNLYNKFTNDENLLFNKNDFKEPRFSQLFKELLSLPNHEVKKLTTELLKKLRKRIIIPFKVKMILFFSIGIAVFGALYNNYYKKESNEGISKQHIEPYQIQPVEKKQIDNSGIEQSLTNERNTNAVQRVSVKEIPSVDITSTLSNSPAGASEKSTAPVNNPPVMSIIGDKTVFVGTPLQFTISSTDPDGGALTYSASGLPTGASFSNQTFSWIPVSSQTGAFDVIFTVHDAAGDADSQHVAISVLPQLVTQPLAEDVTDLIQQLKDDDWVIRERAAMGLAEEKSVASVEPLVALLKDEYWRVRKAAVFALGEIKDARATELLIGMLKDEDEIVRSAAVRALMEIGGIRAIEALNITAREDEDDRVQRNAIEAVNKIKEKTGKEKR